MCFRQPVPTVSLERKRSSAYKNNMSRGSRELYRGHLESLCLEILPLQLHLIFRSQTSKELSIGVICKLQKTQNPCAVRAQPYQGWCLVSGAVFSTCAHKAMQVEHYDVHCGSAMQETEQRGPVKPPKNWCLHHWIDWAVTANVTATESTWSYQHRTALLLHSAY